MSVRTSQHCSYLITKIFVRRMKWLNLWVGPCASSAMREAASKGNPMAAPAPAQEEDRWTADRCCTVAKHIRAILRLLRKRSKILKTSKRRRQPESLRLSNALCLLSVKRATFLAVLVRMATLRRRHPAFNEKLTTFDRTSTEHIS